MSDDGLAHRNADTAMRAIRAMETKLVEYDRRIANMQAALSTMVERLAALEKMTLRYMASSLGSGPTEKSDAD